MSPDPSLAFVGEIFGLYGFHFMVYCRLLLNVVYANHPWCLRPAPLSPNISTAPAPIQGEIWLCFVTLPPHALGSVCTWGCHTEASVYADCVAVLPCTPKRFLCMEMNMEAFGLSWNKEHNLRQVRKAISESQKFQLRLKEKISKA